MSIIVVNDIIYNLENELIKIGMFNKKEYQELRTNIQLHKIYTDKNENKKTCYLYVFKEFLQLHQSKLKKQGLSRKKIIDEIKDLY